MKWIHKSSTPVSSTPTRVLGELELGDNRNNPGLLFDLLVRAFSGPHRYGKGDAIIYSCKATCLLPETESAHLGLYPETAGRALRPSETVVLPRSSTVTPRTDQLRPADGTPRNRYPHAA